jgi:hypothetical protein
MTQILDAHPSVVVAHCKELEKFLFLMYDEGYPKAAYRLSANNIGGNPEQDSVSPEGTLITEICEELDPNHKNTKCGKVVNWAQDEEIRAVRNSILGRVEPYKDFLVRQTGVIPGGNSPYTAIYSTFYLRVPSDIIECVQRNIGKKKEMTTEGFFGIFSLEELTHHERGEFSTAHASAPILNYMFGSRIPHPRQISAEPVGNVRRAYKDYLGDFEYNNKNLAAATQAKL